MPDPAFALLGSAVDRRDGPVKTTGRARYSAEYHYDDVVYAELVYSTISRATITAIDAVEAQAVPGVITVLTHLNAPALAPVQPAGMMPSMLATTVEYLNTDQVRWNGQPVAVVVACTLEVAQHAATLVQVSYRPEPSAVDFTAAAPLAYPEPRGLTPTEIVIGDAEAAMAAAASTVDETYTTPPYNHNALEMHATTAVWNGDQVTIHDGTQNIFALREVIAQKFVVDEENVHVVCPQVGGAFGGRTMVWAGTVLAVLAARVTQRPVRLMLSREGVYRTVGGRTPSIQRVALAADPSGRLTSIIHSSVATQSSVGGFGEAITVASGEMYAAANLVYRQEVVDLDIVANTVMRAPGESIGSFAMESAIDELAAQIGIDPIEFRVRNEPTTSPTDGRSYSSRHVVTALRLGAQQFGWSRRSPVPGASRDGKYLIGTGVASALHPAWRFAADIIVRLAVDGTVAVQCAFHEMGMGAATAQAMIAADLLGLPLDSVSVEYGDSSLPPGPGAGGSTQTATVAASLVDACERVKADALARASGAVDSPLHGAAFADVEAADSGLRLRADPGRSESYKEILSRSGDSFIERRVGETGLAGRAGFSRRTVEEMLAARDTVKASTGAQFCEVRVDADTGEIRVTRWLGVFNVGRVVNAKTTASQLRGGIVMGIGMALTEETLIDPRSGRIMNPSLAEYHIPVHADVPPIEIRCLDIPDPGTPLGILGAGEVGIIGCAAAVANALYNATGRRVRSLPITLDKLF